MTSAGALRITLVGLVCGGLYLLAGWASAGAQESTAVDDEREPLEAEDAAADDEDADTIAYEVRLDGLDDNEALRELLRSASQAIAKRNDPPANSLVLGQRARRDIETFQRGLRANGYYDGEVTYTIEQIDGIETIIFDISAGTQYRFGDVAVSVVDPQGYPDIDPARLGLVAGEPAIAEAVVTAENQLLREAREAGRGLAKLGDRQALVDLDQKTMDVTLVLQPGPETTLGEVTFSGLEDVNESFARKQIPWEPGVTLFSPQEIETFRNALSGDRIFSGIRIQVAEETAPDGSLPVSVDLVERPPRTLSIGAQWRTDEGPGVLFTWVHRNLFGNAERLNAELEASQIRQRALLGITKPDFRRQDQEIGLEAEFLREETDAFDSLSFSIGGGIQRTLRRNPLTFEPVETVSAGFRLRPVQTSESGDGDDSFLLFSIPLGYRNDTTLNFLDPVDGYRFQIQTAPFYDILDGDLTFLKSEIRSSYYVQLRETPWLVLALRGNIGSIVGADVLDVPADERFYSGGGGSVRGYAFQFASPLDDDNSPIGGNSYLETSIELRTRFTETIGGAVFVDAGSAFLESYPDFQDVDPFPIGAGIGLHYLTPIGPLRLDFAVPLNRRPVDDDFQFYIGLGQAF